MSHASTCPAHDQHPMNRSQKLCECGHEMFTALERYLHCESQIETIRNEMDQIWRAMPLKERELIQGKVKGPHR